MSVPPGCPGNDGVDTGEAGVHVFRFRSGIVVQQFVQVDAVARQSQDEFNRYPHVADYRFPSEHMRPGRDAFQQSPAGGYGSLPCLFGLWVENADPRRLVSVSNLDS